MHSQLFQKKPEERKHVKYAYQHAIHYALQALPERKNCKYEYKHAVYYAFKALPGQAERAQTAIH